MADWENPTSCIAEWVSEWDKAHNYSANLIQDRIDLNAYMPYIDDPYIKGAFGYCASAMLNTSRALDDILIRDTGYSPRYLPAYYALHHTGGDEFELTWQDIIIAWDKMSRAEIMYLVDYLDESRQIVQDDPFTLINDVNPYI